MNSKLVWLATVAATAWCSVASADDSLSCNSNQEASLSWNGEDLGAWEVTDGEVKPFTLPNGFSLGVGLKTVERDLVEILLYDMDHPDQQRLSRTFGGENSLQGFGAKGGANRVDELGDPGILLELSNSGCGARAKIASRK